MARIKIKHPRSRDKATLQRLLGILSSNHVYATQLIPLDDSIIVITSDNNETDKIFNPPCKEQLEKSNFTPILPPEFKANRTVILTRVDDIIYTNEEKDISEELQRHNNWIGDSITEIFKFPKSNTLKITFDHTEKAKKSTTNGLLMYHMRIPPQQVHQDEYIHIKTCMKCYKIEEHNTNQCPKDLNYQICSECGEEGHQWRDCKSTHKKCINCEGQHRTLAMKCPLRKKATLEKRNSNRTAENTYSNVTKTSVIHPPQVQVDKDMPAKIMSCLLHAHLVNVGKPGSFEKVLNQTLTMNNLPSIKIPENPPSTAILNLTMANVNTNTDKNTNTLSNASMHKKNTTTDSEMEQDGEEDAQSTSQQPKMQHQIQGKEIGLQIIASKKEGWPKTVLKTDTLRDALERRKFKWTYTDSKYEEDEVLQLICTNDINLHGCWNLAEDSVFRKIRPGLTRKHSPTRDPRIRKINN